MFCTSWPVGIVSMGCSIVRFIGTITVIICDVVVVVVIVIVVKRRIVVAVVLSCHRCYYNH